MQTIMYKEYPTRLPVDFKKKILQARSAKRKLQTKNTIHDKTALHE